MSSSICRKNFRIEDELRTLGEFSSPSVTSNWRSARKKRLAFSKICLSPAPYSADEKLRAAVCVIETVATIIYEDKHHQAAGPRFDAHVIACSDGLPTGS